MGHRLKYGLVFVGCFLAAAVAFWPASPGPHESPGTFLEPTAEIIGLAANKGSNAALGAFVSTTASGVVRLATTPLLQHAQGLVLLFGDCDAPTSDWWDVPDLADYTAAFVEGGLLAVALSPSVPAPSPAPYVPGVVVEDKASTAAPPPTHGGCWDVSRFDGNQDLDLVSRVVDHLRLAASRLRGANTTSHFPVYAVGFRNGGTFVSLLASAVQLDAIALLGDAPLQPDVAAALADRNPQPGASLFRSRSATFPPSFLASFVDTENATAPLNAAGVGVQAHSGCGPAAWSAAMCTERLPVFLEAGCQDIGKRLIRGKVLRASGVVAAQVDAGVEDTVVGFAAVFEKWAKSSTSTTASVQAAAQAVDVSVRTVTFANGTATPPDVDSWVLRDAKDATFERATRNLLRLLHVISGDVSACCMAGKDVVSFLQRHGRKQGLRSVK